MGGGDSGVYQIFAFLSWKVRRFAPPWQISRASKWDFTNVVYVPFSQGGTNNFTYLLERKSILLLNCLLDIQYNNCDCYIAKGKANP